MHTAIVFCPNHDSIVCLGVSLNNVAHIDVPKDIWMFLLQGKDSRVAYQLCGVCRGLVRM